MKDQINASKILHSSAIYIQSMKTTRSVGKKLNNDQKCPKKNLHLHVGTRAACMPFFFLTNKT